MIQLPTGFWPHQVEAVQKIAEYLEVEDRRDRAALITMPTGTGKTGVIAATVSLLPVLSGPRLVLTPWDALVRQLITDLRFRFWEHLPVKDRPQVSRVVRLPPSSNLDLIARETESKIFVATIAAISVMQQAAQDVHRSMADVFAGFGCVIVDEGHYEPAYHWSKAIRSLQRPTVLFTATPYRNDEKFFQIDDRWRFRFGHQEAQDRRFLREPAFQDLDAQTPGQFVEALVAFVEQHYGADDTRVIVRCRDRNNIMAIVDELVAHGETRTVGVHERFTSGSPYFARNVPGTDFDARYWVHQNKLIEGIDDGRFRVLAFYDRLGNDRAVVQQIGRVLRNPSRSQEDGTAYVLERRIGVTEKTWHSYLRFDSQPQAESAATIPDLVERMLAAQPGAFYYDGTYRDRADLSAANAWQDFAFPLRTRLYRALGEVPALEALTEATTNEWREIDRSVFTTQEPDDATSIIPYITTENSPFMRNGTFLELQFGYTLIRQRDDRLYVYDSRGRTPTSVALKYRPVSPSELHSLFPAGASQLTAVALLNTDIGRQAARSRRVRATAIDDLAPDLADYAYVCSVAEGYTEVAAERFRRYLGLSRARVSDYRSTDSGYSRYSAWLDELHQGMTDARAGATTFTRYASTVPAPSVEDAVARHVLLDLTDDNFDRITDGRRQPVELDDIAVPVVGDACVVTVNGKPHPATIRWDGDGQRYDFESPSLRSEDFREVAGDERELVAYINDEQALRVVPVKRNLLYSHGHFFLPLLPSHRARDFRLLDILQPIEELAAAKSEKGTAIINGNWQADSVFGMISAMAPGSDPPAPPAWIAVLNHPDMLLCTDLGTEVADFVATQDQLAVFIHAKASAQTHLYSASALHDAASQVVKNLPYLQPLNEVRPRLSNWSRPWRAGGITGSTRRLRVGDYSSAVDMWARIRRVTSDPNGSREVWMVLGNSLSKEALIKAGRKDDVSPEAIQVYALLQTTWAAVSQLGARFRVFCSP